MVQSTKATSPLDLWRRTFPYFFHFSKGTNVAEGADAKPRAYAKKKEKDNPNGDEKRKNVP